jgi:hypothetical protein
MNPPQSGGAPGEWSEDELKKYKSFFESYILTDSIASGIIKR